MADASSSNWRLVKCPRCFRLLPERDDFRLYKCGGCGTFLKGIYLHSFFHHKFSQISSSLNNLPPSYSPAKNKQPENGKKVINGSSESIPAAPDSDTKNKATSHSETEEIFTEEEKIKQKRIFEAGSPSNGRVIMRQSSGSEIEDFQSARISLTGLSLSKSASKNSAILEDQPKFRNFQEPDRRAAMLRELDFIRYRLTDPDAQEVNARSSRDLSINDSGSEITSSGRRSMTERYNHHHHHHHDYSPGSSSSGYSGSSKKKKQHLKRHCRPIFGGSPFVICNNCLKLLQLPVDFLISKGRRQKLRCGSCSHILTFFFHDDGRIQEDHPLSFSDGENMSGEKHHLGFPLHHLMGYPSARDIIHLRGEDEDEDDDSVDFYGPQRGQLFTSRANSSPDAEEKEAWREVKSDQSS